MTEILLNGVINLFSIQAAMLGPDKGPTVRTVLQKYLSGHLRLTSYNEYLELFDTALDLHELSDNATRLEHARAVASGLTSLLPRLEQFVLVLRYLESVVYLDSSEGARAVAQAVSEELAIPPAQLEEMRTLCSAPFEVGRLTSNFVTSVPAPEGCACKLLIRPDFEGDITALRLNEVNASFIVSGPHSPISLDSIALTPNSPLLLQPGTILRDVRGNRIYYAEIDATLRGEDRAHQSINFVGTHLNFRYPGSENGLHDFSFNQSGGALVGVMGASGAGKSTLLSILNGQMRPDSGTLCINGTDLHAHPEKLEGVIGYVPQDDLLFEDLTVFDNLYYNASLCLANLTTTERKKRVDGILDELHQLETRDLKVGSPLDKTISGGQRKRLNIALELIREPSILFVDEPTSGLSSADSENVMALLKAQAAKGKLVIVVIHQPSSRIYKMFDTLWVLDKGGRPIFDGNPLDAIVHFRSEIHQAGMEEYACPSCGQVNPEQLFEIIEARAVGEDGQYLRERRTSPQRWHERYLEKRTNQSTEASPPQQTGAVEKRLWRPGLFGQLSTFFMRNAKGRLSNTQYMVINVLEPPLLAFLAALISRGAWGADYVFQTNENLATYFFIAVIVALFLGMSVSAEEINRDRKILRREKFLHLSWPCYVASKTLYLAIVATIQTACIVLIGNTILGIQNMYVATWLILFSCAMASSVLGLNISASMRSAVTIYILIPLLLVPQMMLGGAVIPLDHLLHREAGHRNTPLVADIMPSRWGYEALVVKQYLDNEYMRHFLPYSLDEKQESYLINQYLPNMRALADYPLLEPREPHWRELAERKLRVLRTELGNLEKITDTTSGIDPEIITLDNYSPILRGNIKRYLKTAGNVLFDRRRANMDKVQEIEDRLKEQLGSQGLEDLKNTHFNQDVANKVMNLLSFEYIRISGDRLVQVAAPIAQQPESRWGKAQFMAASKRIGDLVIPTYTFNLAVLWIMTAFLYVALYFRAMPRLLHLGRATLNLFRK